MRCEKSAQMICRIVCKWIKICKRYTEVRKWKAPHNSAYLEFCQSLGYIVIFPGCKSSDCFSVTEGVLLSSPCQILDSIGIFVKFLGDLVFKFVPWWQHFLGGRILYLPLYIHILIIDVKIPTIVYWYFYIYNISRINFMLMSMKKVSPQGLAGNPNLK